MNRFVWIIALITAFQVNAQYGRDRFNDLDTIVEYKNRIGRMDFQLTGLKQGLYWDTLFRNYNIRSVPIFVKNNSGKEIKIVRVPDTDGRFHFFRESDFIVKPGAFCEFSSLPEFCTGPFTKSFSFTYEMDGKQYEFSIPTWGWMVNMN